VSKRIAGIALLLLGVHLSLLIFGSMTKQSIVPWLEGAISVAGALFAVPVFLLAQSGVPGLTGKSSGWAMPQPSVFGFLISGVLWFLIYYFLVYVVGFWIRARREK
jgi:hypothetical protein